MNKEQKLEAIYDKIANKELSFGCKILTDKWIRKVVSVNATNIINEKHYRNNKQNILIIWHPVMIWDVLDYIWIWSKTISGSVIKNTYDIEIMLNLWKYKRRPIEEQDNEVIDYIYNLITNKKWKH